MEAPPGEDAPKTNNPHMSALAALTTPPPPPPETPSSAPPPLPVDSQNYPQAGVPISINLTPQPDALSTPKTRQPTPPGAGYYDPAYAQYYGNSPGQYQAPPNASYWGANAAATAGYQQPQPGTYAPAIPQQQYPGAYPPQQPYGSSVPNSYGYPPPNASVPGPRGQYETPGAGGYRPYNQPRPNYPPHPNYPQSRFPSNSSGSYGPPPGQNDSRGPPYNSGASGSSTAPSTGKYSPTDSSNPLMQPQHSPRGPNVSGGPNASGNSFNYRPTYPNTNSYRPRFPPQNANVQNNSYRSNYSNEAGGRNTSSSGTSNNMQSPGSRDRDNRESSASSQQNTQSPSKPSTPTAKKTTLPPSQWPEGLQSFVQRSFKACVSETAKDLTEKELKTFIPKVFEDGSVHKINWEKHPLPECVTVKSPDRSRGRSSSRSSRGRSPDSRNDRRKRSDRASKRSPPESRHSRRNDRDRRRSRSRDRGGDSKRYSSKKRHNRSDSESSYGSRISSDEEVMRAGNRNKRRYDPSNASSSRDDYNDQRNRNDYFEGRGKRNSQQGRGGKYVDRDNPDDDYHKPGTGDQQTDVRSRLSNRGRGGRGGRDQFDGSSGSQQTSSESDQFSGGRGRGRGGRGRGRGQNSWQQKNSDDNKSNESSQDSGFQSNRGGRGRGRGRGFKPDTTISQNVDTFDENDPRLKARAARFQMQGGNQESSGSGLSAKPLSENGAGRSSPMPIKMSDLNDTSGNDYDVASGDAIVGTSKSITKNYLRLTEAPDPSSVRPKDVLKKSLEYIKDHWKKNKDYMYVCDQLRSVRQDLTVQCIRDDFTVTVYETHARVAIEQGDYQEFNQCQTQLKSLYDAGLPGACWEFTAYRLHYYIFTNAPNDCIHYMRTLNEEGKSQEVVSHAVNVFKSWAHGNYVSYFKLYENAPLMSGYMMDLVIDRERKRAVKLICKVYKPTIEINYLTKVLAFENSDACVAFLVGQGYTTENNTLDCRKAPNPS